VVLGLQTRLGRQLSLQLGSFCAALWLAELGEATVVAETCVVHEVLAAAAAAAAAAGEACAVAEIWAVAEAEILFVLAVARKNAAVREPLALNTHLHLVPE